MYKRQEYGLIGQKLGHSFSKPIHEALAGYRYDLMPLPDEDAAREMCIRDRGRSRWPVRQQVCSFMAASL